MSEHRDYHQGGKPVLRLNLSRSRRTAPHLGQRANISRLFHMLIGFAGIDSTAPGPSSRACVKQLAVRGTQRAVVTEFDKSVGQDVLQEATDKLGGGDGRESESGRWLNPCR